MLSNYRHNLRLAVAGLILALLIISAGSLHADAAAAVLSSGEAKATSAVTNSDDTDDADAEDPDETNVESAKNSLVAIQTGFDDEGTFHLVKQSTGFIVSNKQGSTYIVTTNHAVTLSEKARKKAKVSENAQKSIHIIVRGDVYTPAETNAVLESKDQDFCILSASDVIKLKDPVVFKGDELPEADDIVFSLGFPSGEENMLYEPQDVIIADGISGKTESIEGTDYITHTAEYDKACDGGILTDENGYVIGMLNRSIKKTGYYALPAREIMRVLENAGIPFEAKPTVSKSVWLIGILGIVIIFLIARLIKLIIWKKKNNTNETRKNGSEPEQEREITAHVSTQSRSKVNPLDHTQKISIPETSATGGVINLERGIRSGGQKKTAQKARPRAVLSQLRNNRQIYLQKAEMTIGKSASLVDIAIDENNRISRRHARIFWRGTSGYIIEDLGSSNGTFVNGKRVTSSGAPVEPGDLIRLADEEFEFRLL